MSGNALTKQVIIYDSACVPMIDNSKNKCKISTENYFTVSHSKSGFMLEDIGFSLFVGNVSRC